MTDKQPEALELADMLDAAGLPRGGAIVRTQHAAIERKDALLRQALKTIGTSIPLDAESADALCQTILKELAK